MRRVRNVAIAMAAVTVCALLAACSSEPSDKVPMPVPMPVSTNSATPSASPTKAPDREPTLLPGGSALANLDYFNFVNTRLLAVNSNPSSSAVVENLLNAGFEKSNLEVTPDKTETLQRPADSIQFSVRTSSGCLLGQFQAGEYTSAVGPAVNDGYCLVGETQNIQ